MNKQEIIQYIKQYIFQNTEEKITGQILQDVLLGLVDVIFSDKAVSEIKIVDNKINVLYTDGITEKLDLSPIMPDDSIATYSVGSIKVGDDLSGMFVSDVVERMTVGDTNPTITSFIFINGGPIFEVGNVITSGTELQWKYNKKYYKNNSTILTDAKTGTKLFENKNVTEYVIDSIIPGLTTKGYYPFKVEVRDTNNDIYSRILNIPFGYKMFYGESTKDELMVNEIKNLNQKMIMSFDGEYSFSTIGYKYFVFPNAIDTKKWYLKNVITGFEVPMNLISTISITNDFGIAIDYNVYRTSYSLTNPIKVKVYNE